MLSLFFSGELDFDRLTSCSISFNWRFLNAMSSSARRCIALASFLTETLHLGSFLCAYYCLIIVSDLIPAIFILFILIDCILIKQY